MRWGVAFQDEPPLLVQVRNTLAYIAVRVGNYLGDDVSIDDFIKSPQPQLDEDSAIQELMLWTARVNASNGFIN